MHCMTCGSTHEACSDSCELHGQFAGLVWICRNTDISYSNERRFWWQKATHQWLTVSVSFNTPLLYMHPVCSNACMQHLSSLVVNACKAWWQSKQVPVKYKYQYCANVMWPLSQGMPSPLLRSYILYSVKKFLICNMALSWVVRATCITTAL